MLQLLHRFLSPDHSSLKVCGVTTPEDANELAKIGVDALGINFWHESRRYCPLEEARKFLPRLSGNILRVGVFVNADPDLPRRLLDEGLIDVAQFHGDEDYSYCEIFSGEGMPFFKAIGVGPESDMTEVLPYQATALLLDAPAPDVYGGTGRTIDWNTAASFVDNPSSPPVILAGGITPENAAEALFTSRACALDVASGSESTPGVKDFGKISALLDALHCPPQ
tara:strand:- start:1508 stop:2179 length:672 start_codon:yes stop_codon:yes gene_type:complete